MSKNTSNTDNVSCVLKLTAEEISAIKTILINHIIVNDYEELEKVAGIKLETICSKINNCEIIRNN